MNIPTNKRPRAPSASSSSSLATSPDDTNPPYKASRIGVSFLDTSATSSSSYGTATTVQGSGLVTGHPLYCNLPPTCHHKPTPIANTKDLESHYGTYHAHVCELDNCGCVFPDARLMELHQTECHDPIAALRRERGEKTFQCHIPAPTCGRNFLTPKARRLHLIQAHGYLKEYFFAVTNKGIGGLLKRWGEGATMLRKEWKPREAKGGDVNMKERRGNDDDGIDEDDSDEDQKEDDEDEVVYERYEEVETKEENEEDESADLEATPRMLPRTTGIHSPQSSIASSKGSNSRQSRHHNQHRTNNNNAGAAPADGVAGLTDSLGSLSLVPNSIKFGRGGKSGAVIPNPRGFRGRARGRGGPGGGQLVNVRGMDVDALRGAGHRGGGRGGGPGPGVGNALDGGHTDWVARGRGRGRGLPRGRGRGRGRSY
ncbi:hypothetical protein CVT25_003218 [Psilocybe cyanescens]|uniref:C2H2-type domain-containing protein n=1 Tax=Psilocybe cyanescens TaxID=93625 RepID=A0A409WM34_PSICY|nr:hypothetical protein CVT25_003218 [Psilocybe cyanescens]